MGLLVDSLTQPAWIERALRRVQESGAGEFVLVVRNASQSTEARKSRLATWWRNRRYLLHALYQRIDQVRGGVSPDPFTPVDLAPVLKGVPIMDVAPSQTRMSDTFSASDVEAVGAARPDVLVRLGFRILRGDILKVARYGVWSYHHGDNERYRGGPPCFWEVLEGDPVTGTILQRLTEALDDGEVLYRSWGATNVMSVAGNKPQIYWKSAEFLARAMRNVQLGIRSEPNADPSPYGQRLYGAPTNGQMAAGISRLLLRRARAKWQSLTSIEQWFLAYRYTKGVPDDNREPDLTPFRFKPIYPPKGRFWADPFPIRADGAIYVLFEDFLYSANRGVISAFEMGPEGPVGAPQVVLSCDYHLSYPFVFNWRGSKFMIPETADAKRVELYRMVRAPHEWTLEAVLLDGLSLADCTLAEIGDRWWMFANSADAGASFWDELHLFHAPSPLGPWTPHRLNPVVSDVRTARPAGALFQRNGMWYRPSQDSARGYGSATNIQRILRLDQFDYEEVSVGKLRPEWQPGLTGVHTVNALGGLTMIDARRRIRK
ncbi:MAG TPA: hypothetical protein VFD64_09855 [Gemmatimonadaceae bacterium]|nr:hypothetical protein [Gemmatimonadaceae bacterium]